MIEVRTAKPSPTLNYVGPEYVTISLPLIGATGYTDEIFCPWCRDLFVQADVAGLGSGDEITLTVEGSLDAVGWDDIRSIIDPTATLTPITISTNGCTLMRFGDALPPYVRVGITGAAGVLAAATIQLQAYIQSIS